MSVSKPYERFWNWSKVWEKASISIPTGTFLRWSPSDFAQTLIPSACRPPLFHEPHPRSNISKTVSLLCPLLLKIRAICHGPEIFLYHIERADLLAHASYQPLSIPVSCFPCIPIASPVVSSWTASHAPSSLFLSPCLAALDTMLLSGERH